MAENGQDPGAAKRVIGPPPRWVTALAEFITFFLICVWVFSYLGGVGFSPKEVAVGNDTSPIFNWHPLLMALAFPVFMAEAVLAYRVPLASNLDRAGRKTLHGALHTAALLCIILALVAAFQSHNLKAPVQIPNLYSPHSWLGLLTSVLAAVQYTVALYAFVYPKLAKARRAALAPLHVFLGKSVFVLGLATMAVGCQEKATFLQFNIKPIDLRSGYLSLPAAIEVFLALTGVLVLFNHASSAGVASHARIEDGDLLDDELQEPI